MSDQEKCYYCLRKEGTELFQNKFLCCKFCFIHLEYSTQVHGLKAGFEFPKGFFAAQINEIIKGKLFLGNYEASKNFKLLKDNKITHILVAGKELRQSFEKDFIYLKFNVLDDLQTDLVPLFDQTFQFIENSETVFIHCQAGISRSSSIVIAYLMKKYSWDYQTAYQFTRQRRPEIHPNKNFQKQLKNYQNIIFQNSKEKPKL